MVEYFRRRAIVAGAFVGIVGLIGIFVLRSDAPYLFQGLASRALPLIIISVLCGVGALVLLIRNAPNGARLLAVAAVGSVILAWGAAQWPYILPDSLTLTAAAAPAGTLATVRGRGRARRTDRGPRLRSALRPRSEGISFLRKVSTTNRHSIASL
jgi:cytochrome d ubiquinol oxidase subunit II